MFVKTADSQCLRFWSPLGVTLLSPMSSQSSVSLSKGRSLLFLGSGLNNQVSPQCYQPCYVLCVTSFIITIYVSGRSSYSSGNTSEAK